MILTLGERLNRAAYARGARVGHSDGKQRVGAYAQGEEQFLSSDAAVICEESDNAFWIAGYEHGYRVGASGDTLTAEDQLL